MKQGISQHPLNHKLYHESSLLYLMAAIHDIAFINAD
jgi:hypothetical protein